MKIATAVLAALALKASPVPGRARERNTAPPRPTPSPPSRSWRPFLGWTAGWGIVGLLVAAGIRLASGGIDIGPVLLVSVTMAEVVGVTALVSARLVFPSFLRIPYPVRIGLLVLALFSATAFGTALVLASRPLFSLARWPVVATVIGVNAVLATVAGVALHTIDTLRRQLEATRRTVIRKEAMDRQLEVARDVQRELLPREVPAVEGLEMAGLCVPSDGVGGDYYDFLPLGGDEIALVIADVAGKGVPAALLMAGLQAWVRSLTLPVLTPREVASRLNAMLFRATAPARYATLFYGRYDRRRRTLRYSNAGHYPPFLMDPGGSTVRLTAGGMPIGLLGTASYSEAERALAPGDLLVLCTDGCIEAPGRDGEDFGPDRLLEILRRHRRDPLEEMVGRVHRELTRWRGGAPIPDDFTLVLARVH